LITDERDSWELTREGHRALEEIIARFRSRGRNRWEIDKCFLWRTEFKKIIDPHTSRPHATTNDRLVSADDLMMRPSRP